MAYVRDIRIFRAVSLLHRLCVLIFIIFIIIIMFKEKNRSTHRDTHTHLHAAVSSCVRHSLPLIQALFMLQSHCLLPMSALCLHMYVEC